MKKQLVINSLSLFIVFLFLFTIQLSAQELYTDSNAANPSSESDSTSGWGGNAILTSVSNESYEGSRSLKVGAPATGWYFATYQFPIEVGKEYVIKIHAKRSNNMDDPGFFQWDGFSNFIKQRINTTSWVEHTFTLTANATTGIIKVYAGNPPNSNSAVYIDNISIMGPDGPVGGPSVWTQSGSDITYDNGNVGIGTTTPDELLTVDGRIHAEEVKVSVSVPAPDYVFKEDYKLRSLKEVQGYIEEHGHLPNIPSAAEIESKGVELGSMEMKLLEKIEELTLYILMQEEKLREQDARIQALETTSKQ